MTISTGIAPPVSPEPSREVCLNKLLSTPFRFMYHDDWTTCLRRVAQFHLLKAGPLETRKEADFDWPDIKSFNDFVIRHKLPLLFPSVTNLADKAEAAYRRYRAEFTKQKAKLPHWTCLQFVVNRLVEEAVPASAMKSTKLGDLTHRELGYVFKTVRRLIINARMEAEKKEAEPSEFHLIRHSYFLGDGYKKRKTMKLPKLPKDATPQVAYQMGYMAGYMAAEKSKSRPHNYCLKYKRATGRTLNRNKITRIMNLLDTHGLIVRQYQPSAKLKNAVKVCYKLGPRANVNAGPQPTAKIDGVAA